MESTEYSSRNRDAIICLLSASRSPSPSTRSLQVRWEKLSFVERLHKFQKTAVLVSGVGTAQMSSYLLPAGAVIVCLGWRHEEARNRIEFFDSHILNGLVTVAHLNSFE